MILVLNLFIVHAKTEKKTDITFSKTNKPQKLLSNKSAYL